jgi:hypothetical protein
MVFCVYNREVRKINKKRKVWPSDYNSLETCIRRALHDGEYVHIMFLL